MINLKHQPEAQCNHWFMRGFNLLGEAGPENKILQKLSRNSPQGETSWKCAYTASSVLGFKWVKDAAAAPFC